MAASASGTGRGARGAEPPLRAAPALLSQGYLADSLRRIQKNSNKKLTDLRTGIECALVELEKEVPADQVQDVIRAKISIIFEPFKLTCGTKDTKARLALRRLTRRSPPLTVRRRLGSSALTGSTASRS